MGATDSVLSILIILLPSIFGDFTDSGSEAQCVSPARTQTRHQQGSFTLGPGI
jgi:hypothetical protein